MTNTVIDYKIRLYKVRTTKDFLWILVLKSGKLNGWPRSLRLYRCRAGGNMLYKQWCVLDMLIKRSSSYLSNRSWNLILSFKYPNLCLARLF